MLLKSQEISLKKKDFFKEKVILLYGENQDLINDLNQQITSKFVEEKKIPKSYFEGHFAKSKYFPKPQFLFIFKDNPLRRNK